MTKTSPLKAIIFSDMDGTLLDHENYTWQAASEALLLAQNKNIPVVPCTSKTLAECLAIQSEIGLKGPIIFENGSGLAMPKTLNVLPPSDLEFPMEETDDHWILGFSMSYKALCNTLKQIREAFGFPFRGFNDMSPDEVIAATGLPHEDAVRAQQRRHGEPFLWQGDDLQLESFKQKVEGFGLTLTKGGRFYHVMESASKGSTMVFLTQWLEHAFNLEQAITTIALGDSENDLPMLLAADYAVIVANPSKSALTYPNNAPHNQTVIRTEEAGPAGWNSAILKLLKTEKLHG